MPQAAMPAAIAITLGLLLAVVTFTPLVALAYRRYHRLTWRYVLAWVAFLIYFMAIWAYTLFPFPGPGPVRCVRPQLVPLYSVRDALNYPHGSLGQLLDNPVVAQSTLNVALFVPLGVFISIIWRRGPFISMLAGAGLSLFVETTQLTGVWWLYPCAYRVFDTDDLITNTTGALIGGVVALAIPRTWFRPTPQPPGEPAPVTVGRRLVAMVCDLVSALLLGSVPEMVLEAFIHPNRHWQETWGIWIEFTIPFAVQALCVALSGQTLGDKATLLKLEPARPAWLWRRATRLFGGIGGFLLLGVTTSSSGWPQPLFVAAALIAVLLNRQGRGLPGTLGRQTLVDSRA
ncbi:MAG: VanZ family protein [Bifidobacteriaceae bacterium]|jgi:glycopeptide antibiotics resistance protein|nr:VanZ family protein [Bifidobacteriaceae bacterium]